MGPLVTYAQLWLAGLTGFTDVIGLFSPSLYGGPTRDVRQFPMRSILGPL